MNTTENKTITVSVSIQASLESVWKCYTQPDHITQWNFASEDWHCPKATIDFKEGGNFSWTMAAKDGSFSFDFEGTFLAIKSLQSIEYQIADGRKVQLTFREKDNEVLVEETFEPENQHGEDLQRDGWQAILDQFKKHVESHPH
jgi:uncharacterized protein YndB with AHSA1/START domain